MESMGTNKSLTIRTEAEVDLERAKRKLIFRRIIIVCLIGNVSPHLISDPTQLLPTAVTN